MGGLVSNFRYERLRDPKKKKILVCESIILKPRFNTILKFLVDTQRLGNITDIPFGFSFNSILNSSFFFRSELSRD